MREMTDERMAALLGNIYEAASQPQLWPQVFTELSRYVLVTSMTWTALQHWGYTAASQRPSFDLGEWGPSFYASQGSSPEAEADFFTHWAYQIPLTPNLIQQALARQKVLADHRDITPEFDYDRSAFCHEYALPNDFYYVACASGLSRDTRGQPSVFILTLNRPLRHQHFGNQEYHLLDSLFPHLLRGHRISQQLRELQLQGSLQATALDQHAAAALLLTTSGRVLYANPAGEALLHQGTVLHTEHGGVRARLPAQQAQLEKALHRTGAGLGCPSEHLEFGQAPGPLLSGLLVSAPAPPSLAPAPGRVLTLILRDASQQTVHAAALLQQLYGLTVAEVRAATQLALGLSPEEAAARLGLSRHTVRNQLKQVYAKTGTRRQAELIRLVLNLA